MIPRLLFYWTGVWYVLYFAATNKLFTFCKEKLFPVYAMLDDKTNHHQSVYLKKNKTCRTHVQQFFIEHLPTTTFQCKERNFGYKVLLVSNSDAAWHSFKATLIFICQCCSWAPPPSPATSEVARVRPNFRTRVVHDMPYSC